MKELKIDDIPKQFDLQMYYDPETSIAINATVGRTGGMLYFVGFRDSENKEWKGPVYLTSDLNDAVTSYNQHVSEMETE